MRFQREKSANANHWPIISSVVGALFRDQRTEALGQRMYAGSYRYVRFLKAMSCALKLEMVPFLFV